MRGWAVKVIDRRGRERFVCDGMGDRPSRFLLKEDARERAEFLKMGIAGEVQSVNVVPYPKKGRVGA